MYKVTGKIKYGAVWDNGKCLATFNKGVAKIKDAKTVEKLKSLGYSAEEIADDGSKKE